MVMGDVCAYSCPKRIPCRFLSLFRAPLRGRSGRPGWGGTPQQPFALRQLWSEQGRVPATAGPAALGVCCRSGQLPAQRQCLMSSPGTDREIALQSGPCGPCSGPCCSGTASLLGGVQGCLDMVWLWSSQPHGTKRACSRPVL